MAIENRPFIGTWQLNSKKVIRQAPDALVYVNGKAVLPGCAQCGGAIDIQKYVTAITVDPSVDPIASAGITMQIPKVDEAVMFRDGKFLLQTGMEINIYFRGYFPKTGLHHNTPPDQTGGVDVRESVMYPYYHVFHGVVTDASYEYSGGEYTASLTCRDMLHFWSYQVMSTSGSFFGARPTNSGLRFTLVGHTFTGMTPYQIIYTLYRDVMGAASSVGFALSNVTNKDAQSSTAGNNLWSMALLYWEKRFSQNFNNLRMYGTNGTLFNAYQQAYLGRLGTNDLNNLAKKFADPSVKSEEFDFQADVKAEVGRLVGYDPAALYTSAASERDASRGGLGLNIGEIQAFAADISNFGTVNQFESEYQTKIELATTVRDMTGFEFYQDVDGDFVFKPPFYNMDTEPSKVYCIEDVDIISISFAESEPEATYVKATGSHFKNMAGMGMEGEWGTRAEFVDYRLVAQYGWREASFSTYYITDPRAMYYVAINRLDLENIGVRSANCQIPLRAEMRPGYPVYLRPFDCYYYARSFNHSFTYGGQCTTTLSLVGRRAKFFPPGLRPEDNTPLSVENVKLDNPWLPALPLRSRGSDGQPRYQGFPNVVLALDTEALNPNFIGSGLSTADFSTAEGTKALIKASRNLGVLQIDEGPETEGLSEDEKWRRGPFKVQAGAQGEFIKIPSVESLREQAQGYQKAFQEVQQFQQRGRDVPDTARRNLDQAETQAEPLRRLIEALRRRGKTGISDGEGTLNYLESLMDLKSTFAPGKNIPGHYRYYSSSHPDPRMQGMSDVVLDADTPGTSQAAGLISLENTLRVPGLASEDGEVRFKDIDVVAGLPIMRPNTGTRDGTRAVPTPTHQIGTVAFAQHIIKKKVPLRRKNGGQAASYPRLNLSAALAGRLLAAAQANDFASVQDRFGDTYNSLRSTLQDVLAGLGSNTTLPSLSGALSRQVTDFSASLELGGSVEEQYIQTDASLQQLSEVMGNALARPVAAAFARASGDRQSEWDEMFQRLGMPVSARNTPETTSARTVDREVSVYSPVFPVSDARGYELVGSYLYGRGLSIEPGGNFQQLSDADPFDRVSVDAVDDFINTLITQGGVAKPSVALGALAEQQPEKAAALAIAAGFSDTPNGHTALEAALDAPDMFDQQFANFVSTSLEASQKVTAENAAYNLTNLGKLLGNKGCSCAGTNAGVIMQAGTGEFLEVDRDNLEDWVRDLSDAKASTWEVAREAYQGQIRERTTPTLQDAFERAGRTIRTGTQRAVRSFTSAFDDGDS